MKAYILAAGYATRLYPLTRDRPKPLLEVGGLPILTHVARRMATVDAIDELVVITNARFFDAVDTWRQSNPVSLPVRVLDDGTQDEETRLGAVGDLAFAVEAVRSVWNSSLPNPLSMAKKKTPLSAATNSTA